MKILLALAEGFAITLISCGLAPVATAGEITFSGVIFQSTLDGTGPAVNNLSLNDIQDLQAYTATLVFPGSITAPGSYIGSSLTFSVPAAPAAPMATSSARISALPPRC